MSDKPTRRLTRRQALKRIAAAGGAVVFSNLPQQWQTPLVEVGVLPAHAQGSTQPIAVGTPTPTPTGEPPLGNEFAVMGTSGDGNLIVVFPTANTDLPTPTQNSVPGIPSGSRPHGVAYFGTAERWSPILIIPEFLSSIWQQTRSREPSRRPRPTMRVIAPSLLPLALIMRWRLVSLQPWW